MPYGAVVYVARRTRCSVRVVPMVHVVVKYEY